MTTLTKSQAKARQKLRDPAEFARLVGATLYDKQTEMFRAVFSEPRVTVSGANGTGKDFAAARIMLAWLSKYEGNSKVIVTAPTWRQIDDIVFNEARTAARNWIPTDTTLPLFLRRSPKIEGINEEHYAIGFATKDEPSGRRGLPSGKGLTGYHSPHGLIIVSEAHAVGSSKIDELRRLNPQCMLLTGNPFATSGEFYDSHHSKRHLYHALSISAFDTPNLLEGAPIEGRPEFPGMVTRRDVESRKEEWGDDNPLYVAGVLGQFPANLDDTIVPLSAATQAVQRESEPDGEVIVACDVARFGRDKTVVVRREGPHGRIIWRVQGRDTQQIAGWLGRYCADERVGSVIVDDTGVGGGVTDRLREMGLGQTRLVPFNGGERARDDKRYVNATSEAWFRMRLWFMGIGEYEGTEADIENDGALIGQLTSRGYSYQGDRRIKIQSKKEMDKSPDEADALAMTFAPRGRRPNVTFV